MVTASSAFKIAKPQPSKGFGPQSVATRANDPQTRSARMYTEEQVAEFLQVSLSKLRKWRMKANTNDNGPPFRKIGRLVRYPEDGLLAYVNGE